MSSTSNIEWTGATWNCLAGCEAVSPGCAHCYAATMTRRLEAMGQADYSGLTTDKHFNGKIRCLPHKLDIPLKRKKPTVYFVNSMSDLFHEDVPDEFIDKVFAVMALCPQHTFQVLTKRAERMHAYTQRFLDNSTHLSRYGCWASDTANWLTSNGLRKREPRDGGEDSDATYEALLNAFGGYRHGGFLPNVWLGVSAEDQQRADERIPWLLKTPAAVRFVSAEPLLGPIDFGLRNWADLGRDDCRLDWVIVGGESGPMPRPCCLSWIRLIVDDCQAAGVACFVKQLGGRPIHEHAGGDREHRSYNPCGWREDLPSGRVIAHHGGHLHLKDKKGGDPSEWPADLRIRQYPEPQP